MQDKSSPYRKKLTVAILALIGIIIAIPVSAMPSATAMTTVDWEQGVYHLAIEVTLEEDIYYLPVARRNAEAFVQDRLPFLVLESLADFPVTSSQVVRDFTDADPVLRGAVRDLPFQLVRSVLSSDLAKLHLDYRLPIYPELASLFVDHGSAFPLEPQLGWVPGDLYTGIVIYAADPLPWWGEDEETMLRPTLFPRLLDQTGEIVFSYKNVDPATLVNHGVVAYSRDVMEEGLAARVGANPLRCLATATFGTESTDIVLPEEVIDVIFTRQENIDLLAQGRVLVILPPMPASP